MPHDAPGPIDNQPNDSSSNNAGYKRPQGKLALVITIGLALIGAWVNQQNQRQQPAVPPPVVVDSTERAPATRPPGKVVEPELSPAVSPTPVGAETTDPPPSRGPLAGRIPTKNGNRPHAEPHHDSSAGDSAKNGVRISNVTVHDQRGNVVFQGTVDLQPTLDRIEAGDRLPYSHDGIVFENRERRLPQKPRGYYREYVHLTPKVSGPGAQRVVMGQRGEIYYTHDHYKTFQEIVVK